VSPVASREPPHRIAFLEPQLALDAVDEPLRGTAKVLLFITLFQHLVRHPNVSVIDPDDTELRFVGGDLANLGQLHSDEVHEQLFSRSRRDEVLWLEISFSKVDAPVHLRTLSRAGKKEGFVAVGAQPLSTKILRCLGQWLAARDLEEAPRALETFEHASFLDVCRHLRPRILPALLRAKDDEPGDALEAAPLGAEDATSMAWGIEDVPRSSPEPLDTDALEIPPVLTVEFLRTVAFTSSFDTYDFILAIDPDDPWALRDHFFARLRRGRDFDVLRRMIANAPGWGKPYLSWRRAPGATTTRKQDDGVEDEDDAHAYAAASIRIPGNHWAQANYAWALEDQGRIPEAIRYQKRALVLSGYSSDRYVGLIWLEGRLGRRGMQLRLAPSRVRDLERRLPVGMPEVDVGLFRARLAISDALMGVGRHGEAVALREGLLRGNETRWPHHMETLEHWRKDPARLAQTYAREGHFRGDPGRVLEGLSAVSPHESYGFEALALMRAFIALGQPNFATLAWAHLEARPETHFAGTRLEAARALILTGDLDRGVRELLGVALRHPQHGYEGAIHRLLRLSVSCGAAAWGAVIEKHLARGARTVARLLARDAADFVPGAGGVKAIADALGEARPVPFDGAWLDPLRPYVKREAATRIDALFDAPLVTLGDADSLVDGWISALRGVDVSEEEAAGELVYVATQAIARYLSATTAPPNAGAGALRTVAAEALQACSLLPASFDDKTVRAVLAVIERAAACDEWTLDTWLLRVERAFGLEDRYSGHFESLTVGLPRIARLLRGDERVAAEYRTAHELRRSKADGWGREAHPLLLRLMRAGAEPSHEWSDAAANGLPPEDAVDVHWTCIAATSGHATPSVNAARVLLELGRPEDAFEAVCSGIGFAGESWRKKHLVDLAPYWEAGKMDVPIDWKRCNAEGAAALQKGNLARAIKCFRWCAALDPDNRELWRNLGIAHAQHGDAFEAVRAFARFDDATEGVKLAGLVLCQAKHTKPGLEVLEYIARWFTRAEDHRYHALFAWQANDDAAMARAYGRAWEMDPAALTGVDLDGYAGLLYELGEYAACERVTKRLEAVAGSDLELQACVFHRRACADIGLERWEDALRHVRRAIELNPAAARKRYLLETLARAERREKAPVTGVEKDATAAALESLSEGDFQSAMTLSESADWRLRYVALLASEFRYETENEVPVTPRARKASERVLRDSRGAMDREAILARIEALSIRENALFSLDPPPPLGDRLTRARFRRDLALRGGLPAPPEPDGALPPDAHLPEGAPITHASAYAELLRALCGTNPRGALLARGLDLDTYERVAVAWSAAMARDADLAASVRARMGA
jgi:tetratricopeptide (TPR) repeat protein